MKLKSKSLNILSLGGLIFLIFLPSLNINAIEPKSSQNITINFWYTENDTEKPGITSLITEFEAANPSIDIESLQISFFDARNLFTNSFIAKTESDVMRATRDWIPEFAAANMILPLTDTFNDTDLDDFIDSSIEMATYPDNEGISQIWAYPQLVDTPAIMYNKEIFEAAGINTSSLSFNLSWTWDEYFDILAQVNGTEYEFDGETNNVYATTLAGMMFGCQPYYFGSGANMFSNDSIYMENAIINSTESRNALIFLKNITDSTYTPDWLDQGWGPLNPMFRSGKVAMINQGPWELKQNIETETIFQDGDNLGIIQLPHDEDGNRGAPIGMHGLVVSSHVDPSSDKYDAVIQFVRFMTSVHAQSEGAINYYHVPSRESVMELDPVITAGTYPYVKGYWDAVQAAIRIPVSKDWAQIEADFGDRINEYLADDLSLDECIARTLVLWSEYLPTLKPTASGIVQSDISGYSPLILVGSVAIVMVVFLLKKKKI